MSNSYTKTVPAKLEQLDDILAFSDECLETFGCTMKTSMQVALALEEAFVNIANYSYPDSEGDAALTISSDDSNITFVLSDSGIAFDPMANEDPDITLSAEERRIGGLGIFMVKKIMDDVSYSYINGKNILTMVKKIG